MIASELDDVVETAKEFARITHKTGVMQGKACIRGMRVTVGMILGNLSAGATIDELLDLYPNLSAKTSCRPSPTVPGSRPSARTNSIP